MEEKKMDLAILVLDDDLMIRATLKSFLDRDYRVFLAARPSEALEILGKNDIDVIISDYRLPEMTGIDFVRKAKEINSEPEVIIISSFAEPSTIIEALRLGVADFFRKPFEPDDLKISLERALKYKDLTSSLKKNVSQKKRIENVYRSEIGTEIIGKSPAISKIRELIKKLAKASDTSVLITGESGTGKELVARAIHEWGDRAGSYFGAVNTSAVSEGLFESEFFGHKKGAYTGAISDREGWFEVAHGGTLFLDEIGDMDPGLQVKLLRVLEERKYIKLGTQREKEFNVRIVSATNKDLDELRNGKNFRSDLFFRLAGFEIHIPPLRERNEDIPLLMDYFMDFFNRKMDRQIKGIDKEVEKMLMNYSFPGNIRELRNLFERAFILCDGEVLHDYHFSVLSEKGDSPLNQLQIEDLNLAKLEKKAIRRALELTDNNKSKTAEILGVEWNALHRRMKKYNILL